MMSDMMDEGVEIELECAAGAEATRDGENDNLSRAPRQRANLAIDLVDARGPGIGARDRAADRRGEQFAQLGKPEPSLGDGPSLALPGVVERLQVTWAPARDRRRAPRDIAGPDLCALDGQWPLRAGLDDQRRHGGVRIGGEHQTLAAQVGRRQGPPGG